MDNKRLGVFIIIISVFMSLIMLGYTLEINKHKEECPTCGHSYYKSDLTPYIMLGSVAIVVATLSLGFYLVFFEKSYKTIVERFEQEKNLKINDEKFSIILSALDKDEKIVVKALKEQPGITQSTLKIRTDLSKSKLSAVLKDLEKKDLIKREIKGKTYSIYLKKNF
ncbi:MarR family transcriptional regulator [Candidatus Woesearchaeota archaeon]|nr:MarR family transcriptional regulator [Candidatus Woesearchaeota archaeon]